MRSFLGVPIVARGDIIGAIYLTDKEGAAEFDERDERVITVLAAHAAIAIENARLFEASRELSVAEERNRLARDLHDAMTQNLFSLTLTAETAAGLLRTDPERAEVELRRVQELAHETQAELRSLVFGLRPPELDRDGLVTTVGKQLDVLSRAHGLKAEVRSRGDAALETGTEREVYRIVQEALTNIVRHAAATAVTVDLDLAPDTLVVVVRDDGQGFDPDARTIRSRRLGLTSMRERAHDLGGEVVVESAPGAGTTVRIEVPNAG
jgi:signal transduction histidine kinase